MIVIKIIIVKLVMVSNSPIPIVKVGGYLFPSILINCPNKVSINSTVTNDTKYILRRLFLAIMIAHIAIH